MTRLKFRAWCYNYLGSDQKNIVFQEMYYQDNEKKDVVTALIDFLNFIYQHNTYILMQYIGHKDINAKEIYLGDICEQLYRGNKIIGIVKYNPNKACYGLKNQKGFWPIMKNTIKVLGNKFENPELLELLGEPR